ncbi:hypothetical protein V8E54_011335 [Elaphomyces granulatus]
MNQLILKLHQIDKGMKQDGVNEKFLEFPDIDPQTAEKFLRPYNLSRKEPDQCITPAGMSPPTINRMRLDQTPPVPLCEWRHVANAHQLMLIIIKWIDVLQELLQKEESFPAPLHSASQRISIPKQRIFSQILQNLLRSFYISTSTTCVPFPQRRMGGRRPKYVRLSTALH